MNKLVYAGDNLKKVLYFLEMNPEVKINGVYNTNKNFALNYKAGKTKWFPAGNFVSITTQKNYDDLSSVFMLDSNDEKYSSANYLNSLVNLNIRLIDLEDGKNLAFFNNKAYSNYTKIEDVEKDNDIEFSFDENKDSEKRTAYMIADLYNYSDQVHETTFFNDKLKDNRNFACNYLKKLFREKQVNIIINNLDLISELNQEEENNSEVSKRIELLKNNLSKINKLYDNSILGKVREFISQFEKDGNTDYLDDKAKEYVKEAVSDSPEIKRIYNRLFTYKQVKDKEKEVINKQEFGRNAKQILEKSNYAEIKAERIKVFNSVETYTPNEYKGLIPDWLVKNCNKALETSVDEFYKLKAKYYDYFFNKADKLLNRRYELLEYIENTAVLTLSVHKGKERTFIKALNQKDWSDPHALDDYKNEEKYIDKVPEEFRGLRRFIGYKLEWVESGKNWKDEFDIDVLDSYGNPIKKPLFDEKGNIMLDDNGFPFFEGKFTKVPYSCLTGKKTGCDKPNEWCSYQEAIEGIRKYGLDGLSIELGGEGSERLIGLDIDHIYNPDGSTSYEAHDILERLMGKAWIEKSISGTGLHAVIMGNFIVPEGQKKVNNFEMYSDVRAFTISGNTLNLQMSSKREGVKEFREIHKKYMSKPIDKEIKEGEGNTIIVKYKDEKEKYPIDTILKRASLNWETKKDKTNGLNKFDEVLSGRYVGFFKDDSHSFADYWLINQVRYFGATPKQCDQIMRESGLMRDKWDSSRGKNDSYGSITIYNVFNDNKDVYDPLAFIRNKKALEKTQNKKINNNEMEKE